MQRLIPLHILLCLLTGALTAAGQEHLDLTIDSAVDIAMNNSYRVRQLQMNIERTRLNLKAREAGLKSRVYMNLQAPTINATYESKWNSTLRRDEIVREDTRRWQMDLAVRQPVIVFGYPTNGYLSLNNRMYQYTQKEDDGETVDYYNRYFVEFEQPLFMPNRLKNDLELAELDLENQELDYINDLVNIVDDVSGDYFRLFRYSYRDVIYTHQVDNLQEVHDIISAIAQEDTTRQLEAVQVQVELANARERLLENQSEFRLELSRMKQRLRLDEDVELAVEPEVNITPVSVDTEQAIERGFNLRPRLHQLNIRRRRNEIDLENTRGWDKFHLNLEMTYGLEKKDEDYEKLWEEQDNSYSASVNAYIPIWDWGRQDAYVEASEINIERTDLYIEESRSSIRSEIVNAVANVNEYQERALAMEDNLQVSMDLTDQSISQFSRGNITVQEVMQIIDRQRESEMNYLEAYLGYRQSLVRLMEETYYDYEKDMPVIEIFSSEQTVAESSDDVMNSIQ